MTKRALKLAILLCLATLMAKSFFAIPLSLATSKPSGITIPQNAFCSMLQIMRAHSFGALEFQNGEVAIKRLDYEAISTEIERVRPEARHSDPHTVRCREDHLELRFGSAPTYNLHQHLYRCVY